MQGMSRRTTNFFKHEHEQFKQESVVPVENGNRAATAKLIYPKIVVQTVEPSTEPGKVPVAWYYKRYPGHPGRPVRCATYSDAQYLLMDVYGTGRIGPLFK